MRKSNLRWKYRAILTETLPYEVPVIFGNDKFFKMLIKNEADAGSPLEIELKNVINKFLKLKKPDEHSIPYNYSIAKDSIRTTTLSIVHPLWQINACNFYCTYEGSLISSCNKSAYSLRKPTAVASIYSEKEGEKDKTLKTGKVHVDAGDSILDLSNIVSFFVYKKFNLLSKFYNSSEFIDLEKKFPFLRNIDVSKCFYNLYTHSVTWAVKNKKFAKDNRSAYSFEGKFDKIMQLCNYNETNGIVVGPEISRIFAEIIFQDIDNKVLHDLAEKKQVHGINYAVRRYVDDYIIFAEGEENLDRIEKVIRTRLEEYKLYVNDKKISTLKRPFITPLSIARRELRVVLRELHSSIETIVQSDSTHKHFRPHGVVRSAIADLRAIVRKHNIEFSAISGWIISALRKLITHANKTLLDAPTTDASERWLQVVRSILNLAFYVCATDMRVRTTYSLCQMLFSLSHGRGKLPTEVYERVLSFSCEELCSIIITYSARSNEQAAGSIEIFNLLITGAFFIGEDFIRNESIEKVFMKIAEGEPTYFGYVSLKFCLLRDKKYYDALLKLLNSKVHKHLTCGANPKYAAEDYLLLCDYMSAPDIEERDKREVFIKLFGGKISAAAITDLATHVGFVDWTGVDVEHALKRKQLRPVYAMA